MLKKPIFGCRIAERHECPAEESPSIRRSGGYELRTRQYENIIDGRPMCDRLVFGAGFRGDREINMSSRVWNAGKQAIH